MQYKHHKDLWHSKINHHKRTLKMPCVLYRRLWGDLIEVFKITHKKCDKSVFAGILKVHNESKWITGGHSLNSKQYPRLNVCGNFFSLRINTKHFWIPTRQSLLPMRHYYQLWQMPDILKANISWLVLSQYKPNRWGVKALIAYYQKHFKYVTNMDIILQSIRYVHRLFVL